MSRSLMFVFCFGLFSPGVVGASEVNIAYVDLNYALNNVEEGRRAKAILERDYEKKKSELETANKDLQKMREELDAKRMVLSEDALRKKMIELEGRQLGFQKKLMAHQQDWTKKEGELTAEILGKLVEIVKEIGKSKGYEYVLEKTESNILYAPESANITEELIGRYNKVAGRK